MPPPDKSLLPRKSDLQSLNDEQVRAVVALVDSEGRRGLIYSVLGMVCGTISFLASLAAFVYLVLHGHERVAAVVLGATIVTIVGRMIQGRTRE